MAAVTQMLLSARGAQRASAVRCARAPGAAGVHRHARCAMLGPMRMPRHHPTLPLRALRTLAAVGLTAALAACGGPSPAPDPVDGAGDGGAERDADDASDTALTPDTLACVPGARYCTGAREAALCDEAGAGPASVTPCTGATACEPATGLCRATVCEPDKVQCLTLGTYHRCRADGSSWGEPEGCPAERFCAEGACRACPAERVECLSEATFRQCAADSSGWSPETPCPEGELCLGQACVPCAMEASCPTPDSLRRRCAEPGAAYDVTVTCPPGTSCLDGGCYACSPGAEACADDGHSRRCAADGLSWEAPTACAEGEVCLDGRCQLYLCVPQVLLLIDGSGSMVPHWSAVQAAVATLVTDNPALRFGLAVFPSGGASCGTDGLLQVTFAPNNGGAIAAWFADYAPTGATPLWKALDEVDARAPAWFGEYGGTVVLLSDGEDTCFAPSTAHPGPLKAELATTTSHLNLVRKVTTYVIGYNFGPATEMIDTIARNGGTSFTAHIPAGNEADLTAAFQAIVGDLKLCSPNP